MKHLRSLQCLYNHSCKTYQWLPAIEGSQDITFFNNADFCWNFSIKSFTVKWDSVDGPMDKHQHLLFKTVSVTCWEGDLHFTIKWCDYLVSWFNSGTFLPIPWWEDSSLTHTFRATTLTFKWCSDCFGLQCNWADSADAISSAPTSFWAQLLPLLWRSK